MVSALRYITVRDTSSDMESDRVIESTTGYDDVSYSSVSLPAFINFIEETGTLTINFGIKGRRVEVLESDALVLVTIIDGKIADIELLLTNKDAIKKLSETLKPNSNR